MGSCEIARATEAGDRKGYLNLKRPPLRFPWKHIARLVVGHSDLVGRVGRKGDSVFRRMSLNKAILTSESAFGGRRYRSFALQSYLQVQGD